MSRGKVSRELSGFLSELAPPGRFGMQTVTGVDLMERDETRIGGAVRLSVAWSHDAAMFGEALARSLVSAVSATCFVISDAGRRFIDAE